MWALNDPGGPPPEGDLGAALGLTDPGDEVCAVVARVAAVTAARLRLSVPPLGDGRPAGLGAVLVAAVVGARGGPLAPDLARVIPVPRSAYDMLAYHAVAAPALPYAPRLAGVLRDRSPLTGVLDHPGAAGVSDCEALIDRLRVDPSARSLLTLRFAQPVTTPEQSAWRGESLAWLRHEDVEFVLDVYETALVHHRAEHERRTRGAWRAVLAGDPEVAKPVAAWWRALAELESAEPRRLKARPGLIDYHSWTNLFRRVRTLEDST